MSETSITRATLSSPSVTKNFGRRRISVTSAMSTSKGGQASSFKKKKPLFDDHIPIKEIEAGLLDGRFFTGRLRVTPSNRKVAYVSCNGLSIDVRIDDEMRNRSIHGDIVAVSLLPTSRWFNTNKLPIGVTEMPNSSHLGSSEDRSVQQELWLMQESLFVTELRTKTENLFDHLKVTNTMIEKQCRNGEFQPTGKVVQIMQKTRAKVVVGALSAGCQLKKGLSLPESENFVTFKPKDSTYPHLIISRANLPVEYLRDPFKQQHCFYQADISDDWSRSSRFPHGSHVRSIGEMGCIHAETEVILISLGINHGNYSDDMLEPLNQILFESNLDEESEEQATRTISWTIPESEILKRRDLRGYRIFTIDPYNAKDLDDALHITALDDGTYEIG